MAVELQNKFLLDYFHISEDQLTYKGDNDYLTSEAIQFLAGIPVGPTLTQIDLSFSRLDLDLRPLDQITYLEILILDNCSLSDQHQLPSIPSLRTLSLNKNNLRNLELLLDRLKPNQFFLEHLSLLANPLCPHPVLESADFDENLYQRYRNRVVYRLQNLRFLDSRPVNPYERLDSQRSGQIVLTHYVLSNKNDRHQSNTETKIVGVRRQKSNPGDFKIFYPGTEEPDSAVHKKKKKKETYYGKLRYKYSGRNSEGNRFIKDNDL